MTAAHPAPVVALIPARSPGRGLNRLAAVLSPEQRAALGRAMLADVLAALGAAPVDRVVVAASGPDAAAAARSLGAEVVEDPPDVDGLDGAVAAAAATLPSDVQLLVVMADLPELSADAVSMLLSHPSEVVIAANDDGGTSALLRRPGTAIPTSYGVGSAARHLALAQEAGRSVELVRVPGFTRDVDTADDLDRLRVWPTGLGASTAAFIRALDATDGTAAAG